MKKNKSFWTLSNLIVLGALLAALFLSTFQSNLATGEVAPWSLIFARLALLFLGTTFIWLLTLKDVKIQIEILFLLAFLGCLGVVGYGLEYPPETPNWAITIETTSLILLGAFLGFQLEKISTWK